MGIHIKSLWLVGVAVITFGYVSIDLFAAPRDDRFVQVNEIKTTLHIHQKEHPQQVEDHTTAKPEISSIPTKSDPPAAPKGGRSDWNSKEGHFSNSTVILLHSFTSAGFTSKLYYHKETCTGWFSTKRQSINSCKEYVSNQRFSDDVAIAEWIQTFFGPEHMRVQLRGPEIVMGNTTFHNTEVDIHGNRQPECSYISHFVLGRTGSYSLWAEHIYEAYGAVNETIEKTWYPMIGSDLAPDHPELTCSRDMPVPIKPCGRQQSLSWGRWVDAGRDHSNFQKEYPGYWLHYKHEAKVNKYTPDILGRINFGRVYKWEPYDCTHNHYPRESILKILRNRRITLFGDSHMRMTFYGLLQRMNIDFPHNKVWRGDRTDTIPSHNITISYVAAYFLNMSRASAQEMLLKGDIVVAGVGQHHASGCWSIRKHTQIVNEAMETFDAHPKLKIIWLGVPAHPLNKHIRSHQHRTDCRNNLRHRYECVLFL
eukprot:TRINITY_DN13513_c0_g2_i2.p1 TRINITY_DN13513_c0_g2~~TRINITY_DN13513_c0_g2_i2.p1  ORF type:complete len:481 (+),score=48.44 TRINITY_DN13513_c0_g2_i2:85-1527(+)